MQSNLLYWQDLHLRDIDVCHLGRSWQYDVGAIYDGRLNEYFFNWKGRKLKLIPQTTIQFGQPKFDQATFCITSESSLMMEFKQNYTILALTVLKVKPEIKEQNLSDSIQHCYKTS